MKGQIWVMNVDGANPHPVTQDQADYGYHFFSRDGKALFVTRSTPSLAVNLWENYRVDLGRPGTVVPVSEAEYKKAVSENALAAKKTTEPAFTEYETATEKTFVCLRVRGRNGKPDRIVRLHEGGEIVVSPDKRRLAFLAPPFGQNLWTANMEGTELRHVHRSSNHFSNVSFRRDGKSLYFYEVDANGPVSISRVAADGSGYTQVAHTSK